jgi:hypothetical protein
MIKTHNITKLKYLCYHFGDYASCYIYPGSGKYWKTHINKHGKYISTEIIGEYDSLEDAKRNGLYYSKLYNVVDSKDFANLIEEDASHNFNHLTKEQRSKSIENRQKRRKENGFTESEILNHKRFNKIKWKLTENRSNHYINRKNRLNNKEFTEAELAGYKKMSKKLKGIPSSEKYNIEGYTNPTKNKTFKEIIGPDYIHPKRKQWHLIVNGKSKFLIDSTHELRKIISYAIIKQINHNNFYKVIRTNNTKHEFQNGDILELKYLGDSGDILKIDN